ncbi:hypothetical protein B5G00_15560 [Blautia sp. An46]|nr:hypothetical protein B5G00_15560 [Blautia sp. An46]
MENLTGGTPPVRYLPCVVPCKLYFVKVKQPVYRLAVLEKVFLLMGCSKNYIMYWGVFTVIIIA